MQRGLDRVRTLTVLAALLASPVVWGQGGEGSPFPSPQEVPMEIPGDAAATPGPSSAGEPPPMDMPEMDIPDMDIPQMPDAPMDMPAGIPPLPADAGADVPDIDLGKLNGKRRWLEIGGYLKNETAYRFDEPRTFTKIRNILSLNFQLNLGRRARLYASGWTYYDSAYDLFDYDTIAARDRRNDKEPLVFIEDLPQEKDSEVADLREFYLDLYLPGMDVRLGRQFVIWGVLEGIRVVDEINPMDFRELILPELLDYRIPLWTAKVDLYRGDNTLEFLWIPDLRFHKSAPRGSEWELFQTLPATTYPKSFDPRFSEFGVRWTRPFLGAEVGLSYFYTWDDFPTTFRVISIDDINSTEPVNDLPIWPTHTRIGMYGLTFTREIGGNILKGELAYVTDKYFAILDVDQDGDGYIDHDGEIQRDHIRWGIGYDFSWGGADFSPAFAQWIILDYSPLILQDQYDSSFNLFIRKPLRKRAAVFSLLLIQLINFEETYIKPKMTFDLGSHFQVAAGADIFYGQKTQFGRAFDPNAPGNLIDVQQRARFLGNFRDNRRVFVEFKYSF